MRFLKKAYTAANCQNKNERANSSNNKTNDRMDSDNSKRYYLIMDGGDVTATVRLRNKTLKRLRKLAGNGEGLDEVITRLLSVKPRD